MILTFLLIIIQFESISCSNSKFPAQHSSSKASLEYAVEEFTVTSMRLRGGRKNSGKGNDGAAYTRSAAGGSSLAPRMPNVHRRHKRNPSSVAARHQLDVIDQRLFNAGSSDVSAIEDYERQAFPDLSASRRQGRSSSPASFSAASTPPPPSDSLQGGDWGREGAASDAAVGPPVDPLPQVRPVTFEYDHAEAAAAQELEQRGRSVCVRPRGAGGLRRGFMVVGAAGPARPVYMTCTQGKPA